MGRKFFTRAMKPVGFWTAPAAVSGPSESQDLHDSTYPITQASWSFYAGQRNWSNAGAKHITRIDLMLSLGGGSITGKTYTAKIWSMNGDTTTLGSVVATSSGVTGSNAWSATWVRFDIDYTTTGGVPYGITVDCTTADGDNWAVMNYIAVSQGAPGSVERWNSAGVYQQGTGGEATMRIWY